MILSEPEKRKLEKQVLDFVEKRGAPVLDGDVVDAVSAKAGTPEAHVVDAVRRLVDWRRLRFNNSWLLEKL
jgi:fructoselysine-6-P-deglycase FrlB-like protein